MSKKIAIVGAGPSGLVSAKYALQYGLEPVVFEKSRFVGGLWAPEDTAIWDGLRTNLSRFMMMYSDHPWPEHSNTFPLKQHIYDYYRSYVEKFNLEPYIKFRHSVEHVKQSEQQKWTLDYVDLSTSVKHSESFDYVIIASGLYTKPRIPTIEKSSTFKGLLIHSSQFRLNDERFKDKDVIVVGGSLSGVDISTHLVGHAKSVVNIFKRTPLIFSNLMKREVVDSKRLFRIVPYDSVLFSRENSYPPASLTPEQAAAGKRNLFKELFPKQTNRTLCPDENLYVDLDQENNVFLIARSDFYLDYAKQNRLRPIKSQISSFHPNGVELENGMSLTADVVIFCTGYEQGIDSILDKSLLEVIKYDPAKYKFSNLLYKLTFPPRFKNIAFVGLGGGLFNPAFELQAKWVFSVFTGESKLPDEVNIQSYLTDLEAKRVTDRHSNFPYGLPVQLVDEFAKELNLYPDFERLKREEPQLHDMLWCNVTFASHFFLNSDNSEGRRLLEQVEDYKRQLYEFDGRNSSSITQADLIRLFSKHFIL